MRHGALWFAVLMCVCAQAQTPTPANAEEPAGSDEDTPAREMVNWNHYEGKWFSIRGGGGFLVDYVGYAQDDASKEQISLQTKYQLRDARALFKGKLKFFGSREVTWTAGIMYDPPSHSWQFRQTGINVKVPEIWGDIFVGRTKEGVSLNKVMIGYGGWTMERAAANDAFLPILADGIKWTGHAPKTKLFWNAGIYGDKLSRGLIFSKYRWLTAGRLGYVKFLAPDSGNLLHAALNLRYAVPLHDELQLRSRPEAYPAPYIVDTGKFEAKNTKTIGPEIYWREGSFLSGSEYFLVNVNRGGAENAWFHGGEVFTSWLVTGETRSYNTRGGFFNQISPKKTVFEGGHGAVELVLRYSYIDLDSAGIRGGKFWRVTPMASWFLSDHVRLEFNYGYGSLNRFELNGKTQFFQTRIQLQL